MKRPHTQQPGYYLPMVLAFAAIVLIVSSSIITLAYTNFRVVSGQGRSNSALNVAEAGINYYLWHLSHNNQDYCDGNAPCTGTGPFGPYVKEYRDTLGEVVGSYSITVTPPPTNGTSATVRSVGTTTSGETRTVVATLGIPSFAQYSFVTNSQTWFGDSEQTVGLVHSNNGIRFDGTATGVVTSAVTNYRPSDCFGGSGNQQKNGIWGSGGPTSYWNYPVPQVDFNQLTSSLNGMQTAAQAGGIFLPTLVNGQGNKTHDGYALQLNADNTIRVGKVTGQSDNGGTGGSCANHGATVSRMQSVTWEATARAMPANGVIYVADNAWVWGTLNSRLTIAAGRLPDTPATNTRIFLQNDILYGANGSVKDGSVALGLIAQSDIIVNSNSEDNLEIDAYLLSQKGKVFRPLYSNNVKSQITIYGGIATYSWWTWSWVNGSGTTTSGYQNTTQIYDNYLALNPPPMFPKTGSFAILSWKEEPIL